MRFTLRIIHSFGIAAILFLLLNSSCKKDENYDTNPGLELEFSTDSVLFDTVFTTLGSATRVLMVYNPSKKPVLISSIGLDQGTSSQFRINVDGISAERVENIEIEGNDSLYVFVKVRVDPTNQNSPLVVSDKISFVTNGNQQSIELVAWGQDANYIVANHYGGGLPPYRIVASANQNITWQNDKPYVVYGYAVVDSLGVLNIEKGTRVHFHKNSGLWVYRYGSLRVNGTLEEPVLFQGDRLEEEYQDIPGQWDRIWINESPVDNVINYAIIKNGFIGLQLETLSESLGNKLILSNTLVHNMTGWGVFTRLYNVTAWNCEFTECGLDAVYLSTGGTYDFRHCTMGNYWSGSVRKTPALLVTNYYKDDYNNVTYTGDLKKAFFGNCIIYGNLDDEIILDTIPDVLFKCRIENCLIKSKIYADSLVNCLRNQDPLFMDLEKQDYLLQETSPARGIGNVDIATPVPLDYFGVSRLPLPDLGAYQFKR
ncbi:MAG: hypothetical protein AB9842_07050 [Bacteroidales bacterium]